MNFTIQKEVFQKFHPKFEVAFLLVENINQKNKVKESQELLKEVEKMVSLVFHNENFKTHQLISPWAVLQQEFGKKAKHYQTSVEQLLTKVLKKKKLNTKNSLINITNYLSLKYLVPIAIDDLDKIKGDLTFKLAKGKEKATFLKTLKEKALYYRDSKRILGTKLDFWKNPKTKPDKKTKRLLIHIEALPPINNQKLKKITQEAKDLIESFCQGKVKIFILNKRKNSQKI